MRYAGLLICLCLTACSPGPVYKQPEIDAPAAFVSKEVFALLNAGKPASPLELNWWEGFGDSKLTGLVEKAIENNHEIAAAAARARAARANVQLVDADDALRASVSLEKDLEAQTALEGGGNNSDDATLAAGIGLLLPLDLSGRNRRALQAAQAELEAANAELRNVVLGISSAVAREYLRYRGNQRQLELLEESVALQEKTLGIVRSRYNSGLSPELDLHRAQTSVERLRADIPTLLESLSNSKHVLANYIGRYPGSAEIDLDDRGEIPAYQYRLLSPVPVDILRQRPDILRLEADLKGAVASIGVAEAAFYPVFNLFGQMRITAAGIAGSSGLDVFTATLSLLLDQFLLDGGAREANLAIARAEADEALANYQQAQLDAALSIETTLVALRSSLQRQTSLEKAVQSSARSFHQADRLYQLGLSSFLDVVDAQRVLAAAEQQLATERTAYATGIASLFRELGTSIDY